MKQLDKNRYILINKNISVIILININNIYIVALNKTVIIEVRQALVEVYNSKNLGKVKHFLSFSILKDKAAMIILL